LNFDDHEGLHRHSFGGCMMHSPTLWHPQYHGLDHTVYSGALTGTWDWDARCSQLLICCERPCRLIIYIRAYLNCPDDSWFFQLGSQLCSTSYKSPVTFCGGQACARLSPPTSRANGRHSVRQPIPEHLFTLHSTVRQCTRRLPLPILLKTKHMRCALRFVFAFSSCSFRPLVQRFPTTSRPNFYKRTAHTMANLLAAHSKKHKVTVIGSGNWLVLQS